MSLRDVIETKTPLDPAPFMRGVHANAFFVAPSRNIACAIYADGGDSAECTIAHYQFDEPGPDCPDGAVVEVDGSGTPRFVSCAQAPLYTSGSAVLAYGTSVANGRFTCGSAETGISCMNADTGSGFTLSREAFTRY